MERLEERQLLSGFGPEDGAYVVESWIGSYFNVQIQQSDQKIVVAGNVNPNNNNTDTRLAIARYDSLGNADNTFGSGGPSIPPLSGVSAPPLGPSNEYGIDLVLQPDGNAVVSGEQFGKRFICRGPLRHQRHARQRLRQWRVDQSRRGSGGIQPRAGHRPAIHRQDRRGGG